VKTRFRNLTSSKCNNLHRYTVVERKTAALRSLNANVIGELKNAKQSGAEAAAAAAAAVTAAAAAATKLAQSESSAAATAAKLAAVESTASALQGLNGKVIGELKNAKQTAAEASATAAVGLCTLNQVDP
jgi:hypothetical protein